MNFYYETLSKCIEHFGSDHEDAERYIHWITENAVGRNYKLLGLLFYFAKESKRSSPVCLLCHFFLFYLVVDNVA